jgi:hypothetical protein
VAEPVIDRPAMSAKMQAAGSEIVRVLAGFGVGMTDEQ